MMSISSSNPNVMTGTAQALRDASPVDGGINQIGAALANLRTNLYVLANRLQCVRVAVPKSESKGGPVPVPGGSTLEQSLTLHADTIQALNVGVLNLIDELRV